MPTQLLSHTPVYVWIILGVLAWRGLAEWREREVAPRWLFVIPLLMLALALYDILTRFGGSSLALAAWVLACAGSALAVRRFGRSRVLAMTAPDRLRLRGSAVPLSLMMAIFAAKYATAVVLVVRPDAAGKPAFVLAACACFGLLNGAFLGRLALDVAAWRKLGQQLPAATLAR